MFSQCDAQLDIAILLDKGKANPALMILIKPMDESRYENMVEILDEVLQISQGMRLWSSRMMTRRGFREAD